MRNPAPQPGCEHANAPAGRRYGDDPTRPKFPEDKPVIVFDGHCVLCSRFARFILKHDRTGRYRLLPAQTPLGDALYRYFDLDPHDYQTNILLEDGMAWFRSESSIRILAGLGLPWSSAILLRILPRGLRDKFYEWVARNRFRWFGRQDVCMFGVTGHEDRFLS